MKTNTITTPTTSRFRLIQDDSSHWYAIPANKRAAFKKWVESFNDDYKGKPPKEDFDEYRLSMHPTNYSFENFKEDD
jgi:hypothetical protein